MGYKLWQLSIFQLFTSFPISCCKMEQRHPCSSLLKVFHPMLGGSGGAHL